MALRFTGDQNAINKKFMDAQNDVNLKFIRVLRYCAEAAINEARTNGSYRDVTANLRASVGYSLILDGKIVEENYTGNSEGVSKGKSLASELVTQQPEIAIVIVAGMSYAAQVESRGKNVLTSAEQLAKVMVPNLLKQLK